MSGSYTAFPIANVTITALPDLGGITDSSMLVGDRAGTGRFTGTALRDYVMTTVTAGYLQLAGGAVSGSLSVQGPISTAGAYNLSVGGASWSMDTVGTYFAFDNSNYRMLYERANGNLSYERPDGVSLWSVDSNGSNTIRDNLTVGGSAAVAGDLTVSPGNITVSVGGITANGTIGTDSFIAALGDVYARGGHYFFGASDQAVLNTTSGGTSLRFSADGWALSWNATNGTLAFFNNASVPLFTVTSAGDGVFHGTVHGTNVTALEARIAQLETRLAALEAAPR